MHVQEFAEANYSHIQVKAACKQTYIFRHKPAQPEETKPEHLELLLAGPFLRPEYTISNIRHSSITKIHSILKILQTVSIPSSSNKASSCCCSHICPGRAQGFSGQSTASYFVLAQHQPRALWLLNAHIYGKWQLTMSFCISFCSLNCFDRSVAHWGQL